MNDVILNKVANIKRCLTRINEEFSDEAEFKTNFTKQDSVILNLQRACEAAIDIANVLIKQHQLGIPQSSRHCFELIETGKFIDATVAQNLQKMVGLRNIAVHDYQALNIDIVIAVVKHHLSDFELYIKQILNSQSN